MLLSPAFTCAFIASMVIAEEETQRPLNFRNPEDQAGHDGRKRLAIIGGGIAAASLAYRLHDDFGPILPLDITIYEEAPDIGGRINSTIINRGSDQYSGFADTVVIHRDRDLKSRTLADNARDVLKYGLSARKLQKLLQDKLLLFNQLYADNNGVNPNLPNAIQRLGLDEESKKPAYDYFIDQGLPMEMIHDIVQPTVRALFGHDLSEMNAISALVAMDSAKARTQVSTRVNEITRSSNGKYTVVVSENDTPGVSSAQEHHNYDALVIATHLQGSNITIGFPTSLLDPSLPPFVERHVTHFITHQETRLVPSFFHLTTSDEIPETIYTTSESRIHPKIDVFSIERYYQFGDFVGDIVQEMNLYRITSSGLIPDSMVAQMLGGQPGTSPRSSGVKWFDRQVWPLASPQRTRDPQLDSVEIADGLF
ncbi:hypothetical protein BU16DRAFT_616841 [Lophium mytilinum]|uniref:Prenylcysteine lyase domain-containing protein n=1 Tax=Lophium mytilinum TaxID=390894 RepID=A0A6A6QWY3_9PEZI|nr:hypothetical protein BU16DRAFT_616841 [Lophium mytilinum]